MLLWGCLFFESTGQSLLWLKNYVPINGSSPLAKILSISCWLSYTVHYRDYQLSKLPLSPSIQLEIRINRAYYLWGALTEDCSLALRLPHFLMKFKLLNVYSSILVSLADINRDGESVGKLPSFCLCSVLQTVSLCLFLFLKWKLIMKSHKPLGRIPP